MTFPDEVFLAAATAALDLDPPGWDWDVLDSLELWSCTGLGDEDERAGFAALFVAQGETLRSTAGLSALMAQAVLTHPGRAAATYGARSDGHDIVVHAAPEVVHADLAVILLPDSVGTADPAALRPAGGASIDPAVVSTWRIDRCDVTPIEAPSPDDAALTLPRLAAALEMLGAARRGFELACTYAADRRQFGRPISDFQAVRHLLAEGLVHVRLLADACALTLEQPTTDRAILLKALAGRNGRAALQVAQQVFGGIGFTAEHVLHRHQARVLALDAVLGTSAQLTRQLGLAGAVPSTPRLD